MRDDPKFNIAFVSLVRQFPCLYDSTSSDYLSKATQMRAWETIANEVNGTVQECKDRWKNLRGCLTRHLKAKSDSTRCHRKPYYLANHLNFLIPFTKSMSTPRDPVEVIHNGEEPKEQEEKCEESNEVEDPGRKTDGKLEEVNAGNSSPQHQVKREPAEEDFMWATPPEEDFKWGTAKTFGGTTEDDPDLQFLKSLLPDIREMDGSQKRRFKMGVIQLCEDILTRSCRRGSPVARTKLSHRAARVIGDPH